MTRMSFVTISISFKCISCLNVFFFFTQFPDKLKCPFETTWTAQHFLLFNRKHPSHQDFISLWLMEPEFLLWRWCSPLEAAPFARFSSLTSLMLINVGLWIKTECGRLQVSPGEIVVLPQGFRFSVDLPDGPSRGYVAEVFGAHFHLPDLGPIGKWVLMSILMLSNAEKKKMVKCWF